MTNESNQTYKCRYCDKEFRKESTLTAHLCEQNAGGNRNEKLAYNWDCVPIYAFMK